ncbi:hypothetical protein NUW58_g4604 [Xylaria curta]|uniref:Uncharacterized protein n=1 Tax=Xylaria curta TaxID=42375 RepID=A0ACC1P5M5_9PEZI|nr:hypothetical protein NUW58_g4604 [Xylaria curta]
MSSLSRPTSQHRMMAASRCRNFSASPSPSRRKLIRIMQLARDRPRSTSPSRSRSPYAAYTKLETAQHMAKRRQQKTQSRSRAPTSVPMTFEVTPHTNEVRVTAMETIVLPLTATTYKIAVASEVAPAKESGEQE